MTKRFTLGLLVFWVLVGLILPEGASAQGTAAAMSGTIRDETGAVLPGVSIVIRNTDTSLTRELLTEESGHFSALSLPPGPYELTATLAGFSTLVRSGIMLTVGRESVLNLSMTVSQIEDRIEVVGEASTVETTSGSTGTLVAEAQITQLPLSGRSFIELATLSPGAQLTLTGGQEQSTGFGAKISVHGSRYTSNLFTLDGTNLNDQFNSAGSASGNLLGVEAIREFRVQTNSFSAEFGRHTGAVITAATKSGTNAFHGSAFEFHRNDAFDAQNFFADPNNLPDLTRNQYGFSFGGPLLRNKLFFFGTYEGLREELGQTVTYNVPNEAVRSGPVHPAILPYLIAYPLPNGTAIDLQRSRYRQLNVNTTSDNYGLLRIDRQFGSGSQLFARYSHSQATVDRPGLTASQETNTKVQLLTTEHTWVRGSRFLNRAQFAVTHSELNSFNYVAKGISLPRTTFTSYTEDGVLNIGVSGLSGLGGSATLPKLNSFTNYQFSDTVTMLMGRHSLKLGGRLEFLQYPLTSAQDAYGGFAFRSVNEFVNNIPNSFASMLPDSDMSRDLRQNTYGVFIQDDIRVGPRFTLNVGLRYEPTSGVTETQGRLAQLLDWTNPAITANDTVVVEELYLNPTKNNFAPRMSFAWDPRGDGKTALRGGAGVYYDLVTLSSPWVQNTSVRVPPFIRRGQLFRTTTPGGINFPDAFFVQGNLLAARATTEGIQEDLDQPVMYKYNLNVQHEFRGQIAVELGYTGTRGIHLARLVPKNGRLAVEDENGRLFVPGGAAQPLLLPNFGRARRRDTDGTSTYHGFTASVSRRAATWQTQVSYTWSKVIDDGASPLGGNDFEQEAGAGGTRYQSIKDTGLAPFDTRHSLVANVNYELPFGEDGTGVGAALVRDWSLGALVRIGSGYPFPVYSGADRGLQEFAINYPDLAAGASNNPVRGGHEQYFDPLAFVLPPLGYIGNLGRNTVIGPSLMTFDLQVSRGFGLGGDRVLQLRIEAFNLFNRVNLSLPSATIFTGTGARNLDAGRITRTSTSARQIQLGLRFTF